MAETYDPPLSEERCAALLRAEIARRAPSAPAQNFSLEDVETLLRAAEQRSRPRTELPPALNRFPLSLSPWLVQALLRLHRRLFHDQRAVNTVLIQALRETMAVNRYLLGRLAERDSSVGAAATEGPCES